MKSLKSLHELLRKVSILLSDIILAQVKSKIVKEEPLVVPVELDKGPLPKKPTSAYIYFNVECYENARKKDSNYSMLTCSKESGAKWTAMTAQ